MAITTVEIEKFLVFKDKFSADFCNGVNIFIGANSSGKTTLMKAMYAACMLIKEYECDNKPLSKYFDSSEHISDVSMNNGIIQISFNNPSDKMSDNYIKFIINNNEGIWAKEGIHTTVSSPFESPAIYIPPEDMLSHSKGFLALTNERKMPFDQTQIDILSKASIPETNSITPNAEKVIDKIKTIIGGNVVYKNDTFYIIKESGEKVSFSFEASGFRKFGLLLKLLRNGLLENGTILFWDEPENSLNPEILPDLVNILLELQKNGVQIFIATHSYALARWFELNVTKENTLKYFNMRKTESGIEYDTADMYSKLNRSVLEDAGDKLFNAVVKNGMGVNG
jgi:AAA15 family ATPase/GTPase